jgi:ATP-dependent Clp protease ATP-binding subunit ClpX
MGTGARALRTEMEAILGDAMFEAPGSSVKYVLVTEAVARREEGAVYFGRGQGGRFHALIAQEEGDWEEKVRKEREERDSKGRVGRRKGGQGGTDDGEGASVASFEEWRGKVAVGAGAG